MGRTTKQGIDYFSLDCNFDDKVSMYAIETGAEGVGILIIIWQLIYQNNGYYIKNGKDLSLLIKQKAPVELPIIEKCINVCLERNIFSSKLHKKYKILTSKAVQKRYFDAAKRKLKVDYSIDYIIKGIDVSINAIDVNINATKEKEKEKEKENSKLENPRAIAFQKEIDNNYEYISKMQYQITDKQFETLINKFEIENIKSVLNKLDAYILDKNKNYKSVYKTLRSWLS